MTGTKGLDDISTKQQRIAELAKRFETLTTLAHHIDMAWMREAYRRTRKDGAPGVDGQRAEEYGQRLEENLQSLLERAKSGTYRAPAVRRVHIPKGNGETRPIGIPTFEDKVLQRAVTMVLEAVYEQDFLPCSYGFRPRRNAHQCIEALRDGARKMAGGWVLEMDIRKFFDSIQRPRLLEVLSRRVRDGVLSRLVAKWLHAGVMEEGTLTRPKAGTPQGGVISPLLANIYLHEVLDAWFERDVRPRMKGRSYLFRYADDAVMLFEKEDDARRVFEVLPKRFEKYGLTLHPEKTRLVRFRRPDRARDDAADDGVARPGTFDFLGFTHSWARAPDFVWRRPTNFAPTRACSCGSQITSGDPLAGVVRRPVIRRAADRHPPPLSPRNRLDLRSLATQRSGAADSRGRTNSGAHSGGYWVVLRRTARDRFTRALTAVWQWLKKNRHRPLEEQQRGLAQRLRGHYGYYAIRGNKTRAWNFLFFVTRAWKRWLERRSDKAEMGWTRFYRLLERYPLPVP